MVGVPCCPEVFIERAFQAGRPRGFETHMEPTVHEATHANFCSDAYRLAKLRIEFAKTWTQKAKELQRDENSLHDSLPPYLRKVLSGKRLLLLGELMEAAGCPDVGLVRDIYGRASGFRCGCLCQEIPNQK